MRARVLIRPKAGILDPQGQTVPAAQSRTYCLSKEGWPRPGA